MEKLFRPNMLSGLALSLFFIRRAIERHHWFVLIAGVILISTAGLFSLAQFSLKPKADQLFTETEQLAQARAAVESRLRDLAEKPERADRPQWGTSEEVEQLPSSLQAVVDTTAIAWMEAHYGSDVALSAGLIKRPVVVRLKGQYPNGVGFVSQALETIPFLALNSIRVSRGENPDNQVECELQLTAFFVSL
jgi:hypothetical protein